MGFSNGTPTISTDGLVFAVDAGNGQSYVSGSSDCFNLVSKITGSLSDSNGSGMYENINQGTWTFDGVDDMIVGGIFTACDGGSAITLSSWVKAPTGAQSDSYAIILYKAPSNDFGIYQNNLDNQLTFRVVTSGGTVGINGSVDFFDGNWHHITAVYNGSSIIFYEDGIQISTDSQSGTINSAVDDLYIGAQIYGGSSYKNFFNGNIANAKVYNKALTAAEVTQNYNATKGRFI